MHITPEPWMNQGLCSQTDPEEFFPDKGGTSRHAKAICATCPVAAECLDYALTNDEAFGIWGGLSERERRKVKLALNPGTVPCGRGNCPAVFARETDRDRHHANTHDRPDDSFACPACDYTTTVRQGVTLHLRAHHPDLDRTAS